MKITWLGHSSFKLEESTGTVLVTDPYDSAVGYEMPTTSADVVTISHGHHDHAYIQGVEGNPTVVDKPGFYEIKGIHMLGIETYHDDTKGSQRGNNVVFKYRMDGVELAHMGDIGEECNTRIVESIMPVDILMLPIGGNYTIDAAKAKEYVDRIMPDVVIPMHYKTKDCDFDIDRIDDFLDLFDEKDIIYADSNTIEFDRQDFDGEDTKVLVLKKISD